MGTSLDHAVVNSFLRGLQYPLTQRELLRLAQENRVPQDLLAALRTLPDRMYSTQQEIMDELRRQGHNIT